MTQTVELVHEYDASPERLWALVTDYAALEAVMADLVTFEGLPQGRTQTGQIIEVLTSLFGRLPKQPYRMEVLLCDDETRLLRSSERGMGVKRWNHTLQVKTTPSGSRLEEEIEIDAGLLTPIFAAWARYMYRARHKPRLKILAEGWGA